MNNGQITYSPPAVEGKYIGGTTATVTCDWTYKVLGEPYICKKISGVWSWRSKSGNSAVCAGVFTFVDDISPFYGATFTLHLHTHTHTHSLDQVHHRRFKGPPSACEHTHTHTHTHTRSYNIDHTFLCRSMSTYNCFSWQAEVLSPCSLWTVPDIHICINWYMWQELHPNWVHITLW